MKGLRLSGIIDMTDADWIAAIDQYEHIPKSRWVELYYHLYQVAYGQEAACFVIEDIRTRLEIIDSHCKPFELKNVALQSQETSPNAPLDGA